MRKELIVTEEEPEIYVEPGSTFEELKALEKSLEMEKVQAYTPFLGLTYASDEKDPATGAPIMKPLIPKEGAEYIVKNFAEVFDDDPEKIIPSSDNADAPPPEMPVPFAFRPANVAPQSMPNTGGTPSQVLPQTQSASTTVGSGSPQAAASQLRSALTP
jgi:hypothetical protein